MDRPFGRLGIYRAVNGDEGPRERYERMRRGGAPPRPIYRRGRQNEGNHRANNRGGHHNNFDNNRGYHNNRRGFNRNYENALPTIQSARPRPEGRMGFQYVEKLVNSDDMQQVVMTLSSDKSGFKELLNQKEFTDDMLVLLVKLLFNLCNVTFNDIKSNLLTTALRSQFMEKMQLYITNIVNQNAEQRRRNGYFWNDPDQFWNCIIKLSKTVHELIPTNCEVIQKLLKTITVFLPAIEQLVLVPGEIKAQITSLLEIIEEKIQTIEVKRRCVQQGIPVDEDEEPPDDFREISIIPSAQEVVAECSPFLRANIIDKPYNSIGQYLDIQFRLLREDFVAPLRRGISTFLRNQTKPQKEWKKLDDIKIYNQIMFLNVETVNECNCYKIRFDFTKKKKTFVNENSKRFMYGSLVCFTCDNFKNLLFGKIVQRDVKLLEQGLLIVGFLEEVVINFEANYVMVESSVYFEPYYQVLGVLQRMNEDVFPMEKYIVNVDSDARPPDYLLTTEPVMYEVQGSKFWSLNIPNQRFYNLNDAQLGAFKAALTNEFSIIQGPPGTGKTYLGLKIAHTLIQNRHAWYHRTPILVICYTNHALDQFLEGVLENSTDKILRVGGQSKNEKLVKYNIAARRRNINHQAAVHQKRREVRDYMEQQKTLNETLSKIDANESVISFTCFRQVVQDYDQTWFAKVGQDDVKKWLLEGKNTNAAEIRARNVQRQAQQGIQGLNIAENNDEQFDDDDLANEQAEFLDDIFQGIASIGYRPLVSLSQLQEKLDILRNELDKLLQEPENLNNILLHEKIMQEIWENETDFYYLSSQLELYQDPRIRTAPKHVDLKDPRNMRYPDRWQLYYHWLHKYVRELRRQYVEYGLKFREIFRVYNDMREIEDTQLMREHLLVGMTTTGAARLQSSLQALKSPIVIVEEAAEILEAHIVAALTKHCQQLILIGDHLQLKPSAADYKIETRYKLGISLFERMVRNKVECHTLNVQHRMRPEISRLIKPHIYPKLEDHESTLQRSPILGIEKCLYFIDHQEPEDLCQDASKKNIHECKFLIGLARHLILNGYEPEQITILAAYLGQFFEMRRESRKDDNRLLLQDVRISVLDNYQGEESDIILLSLVRSNAENKAGFLRNQNRVCVALSRARDGFYMMGNMSLLLRSESENKIWENVKAVLDEQGAIGTHLSLRCQVHSHKVSQVSKSDDFMKLSEGGCDLLCEAQLGCGHQCKSLCHVRDRAHENYKCTEKCNRVLCEDVAHVCKKLCYQECGPCTYPVPRDLQCGHTVDLDCHLDPVKYLCMVRVFAKLPCDHETHIPCSADPEKYRCPFPCDTRVEPCGHACARSCHIRMDPDHLKYKCMKVCAKPKVGCRLEEHKHICTRLCWQDCEECNQGTKKTRSCDHVYDIPCKLDVEEVECKRRCKKTLPCGHLCRNNCNESCGPCEVSVVKQIPDCLHTAKVKCHQEPVREMCKSKTCPRLLPCGHKCTRPCKLECLDNCKEIVACNILAPCGHNIKTIVCNIKNTTDPNTLLQHCTEPCDAVLKCKHKCTGTCGECKQSRIHKRCAEKCGIPLVCNHECQIPCLKACKPCTRPCEMRCTHSKCKKKCGEPCTPCKSKCSRQCPHAECTRLCGELCNVPPCTEKCNMNLKCGHRCVGFCGDPCPPLCRICDNEDLTEILFGTEDEDDAVFVLLRDCGHVLERSGLEGWLNEGRNQIQFKRCPKCKTTITTTERYSNYVKTAINDVILVKEKSFGRPDENETLRQRLIAELDALQKSCSGLLLMACRKLSDVFEILSVRLEPARLERRQAINQIELNAVQSKIQTLSNIIQCFNESKEKVTRTDSAISLLSVLLDVLLRSEDHVTNQEIEDLEMEIERLHRIVQFDNIQKSNYFNSAQASHAEVRALSENIRETLFAASRYSMILDDVIKKSLKDLVAKVDATMIITDQERIEIVQAMGMARGHWYKCPNGHPYAIGECGGANQVAKCFCGEQIGGTNYHLLPTNQFAGEMDGATRHAWPGGLH